MYRFAAAPDAPFRSPPRAARAGASSYPDTTGARAEACLHHS